MSTGIERADNKRWDVVSLDGHVVIDVLDAPLHWRKPRTACIDGDLFHPSVPDDFIAQVFAVMALAPHHTFQVLTKRPERMREWMSEHDGVCAHTDAPTAYVAWHDWAERKTATHQQHRCRTCGRFAIWLPLGQQPPSWPLPNVWLGVSAEDQDTFDARVPVLLDAPAAVRFVSLEPMLAAIDATHGLTRWADNECPTVCQDINCDCPEKIGLDWVIVGGESGPGARPFDIQWARDIIAQCQAAGVPCFVNQIGADPRRDTLAFGASRPLRLRHRAGGDMSEWPVDLRVREWPGVMP